MHRSFHGYFNNLLLLSLSTDKKMNVWFHIDRSLKKEEKLKSKNLELLLW